MKIVDESSNLIKHVYRNRFTVRWPINGFIAHARNIRTDLNSEHFSLKGLTSKFLLCVKFPRMPKERFDYKFTATHICIKKKIAFILRFWLENIDGEKCAETDGMYF
jgi:hypothetical protein